MIRSVSMAKASVTAAPSGFEFDITNLAQVSTKTRFWRALKNAAWELWRNRIACVGAVMVLILLLESVLATALASHDPLKPNYRQMLQPPSALHYFGTDQFGR